MAGIDSSIYLNQQPIDFLGSVQKGLAIRDGMDQKKAQESERARLQQERANEAAVQQAYQAGMVQNPDGTTGYDMGKVNNALGALTGNPNAGKAMFGLSQTMNDRTTAEKKYADTLAQQERDNIHRQKALDNDAANRATTRAEQRMLAGITRAERHDTRTDDSVGKLSKDISGVQEGINALDEVERNLGFSLDSAQVQNGKVLVNGKAQDLPGVSIPGMGRWSFGDKAQTLQSSAAKVFNTILKDRSGAAVTNTELERLKTEFGEGKYNSESQMVDALQRYKRGVQTELQNREAAYNPEVVQRYAEQGGRTSKSQLSGRPSDKIPKNFDKMSDDQLAAAYAAAGGK